MKNIIKKGFDQILVNLMTYTPAWGLATISIIFPTEFSTGCVENASCEKRAPIVVS
jgi:hypothetical protein